MTNQNTCYQTLIIQVWFLNSETIIRLFASNRVTFKSAFNGFSILIKCQVNHPWTVSVETHAGI